MGVLGVKRNPKRGIVYSSRWARTIRTTANGKRPWRDPAASGSLRRFTHSVTSADCFMRSMPSGATIIRLVSGVRSVRFPMTGAFRGPTRKNTMALLRERKPGVNNPIREIMQTAPTFMDLFVWAWLFFIFLSCFYLGHVVGKLTRRRN